MKKILLGASLIALSTASYAKTSFEGMRLGLGLGHSTQETTFKSKVGQPSVGSKPAGYSLLLNAGHGYDISGGDYYVGMDLDLEKNWAKKTGVSGLKSEKEWGTELSGRLGVYVGCKMLPYLSLGARYDRFKINYAARTLPAYNSISKNLDVLSYTAGFGLMYMFHEKVFADVSYQYAKAFSQTRPNFYAWNKSPTAHIMALKVGYKF